MTNQQFFLDIHLKEKKLLEEKKQSFVHNLAKILVGIEVEYVFGWTHPMGAAVGQAASLSRNLLSDGIPSTLKSKFDSL